MAVALAAACSCGPSPDTGASASPTAAVLDHCLVGTWKSMTISGGLTISGARVNLTGGAGELLTITASGAIRTDDSNTAPLSGTATDGSVYRIAETGKGTGTITVTPGRIAVTLDQPTPITVTLTKNGTVMQTQHPGSATDSYSCSQGSSLVITGSGGTVSTYSPA
jgi:hypothetical protein